MSTSMKSVSGKMQLDLLPRNVPSMCIPRVFPSISRRRIEDTIMDLRIGNLERVDIVSKTAKNGEKYNTVFIHLREWNTRDAYARDMREALMLENGSVNITYDKPYFWKVVANQAVHADRSRPAAVERPTIQINTPTKLLNEELKRRLAIAEKEILETIAREKLHQAKLEADALLQKQTAERAELEEEERKFAQLVEANVESLKKQGKPKSSKKIPLSPEEQKRKAEEASALNRANQLKRNAELRAKKEPAKRESEKSSYYCRQEENPRPVQPSKEEEEEEEDEQAVVYPEPEPEKEAVIDESAAGVFHRKMCKVGGYFDVDAPREEAQYIDYGPVIMPPSIKSRREQKAKRIAEAKAAEEEALIESAADELEEKLYAGLF